MPGKTLKSTDKLRLFEYENPIRGKWWVLEKKYFFGWSQPHCSYAGGAEFNDIDEAIKWYNHIAGGSKTKKTLIFSTSVIKK